jgi:predicted acetyltransferase
MSRKPDEASRLVVRPATMADRPAIQAAYSRLAAANNGFLDRGAYVWSRIYAAGAEPTRGFVLFDPKADEDEQVQGWVFLSQPEAPRPPLPAASGPRKHEVFLHDFGATTPAAASKLWAFLAGFATIGTDLVFFGGPSHPMLMLLPEQVYSLSLRDHWMIRLTNMPAALKARAYPRGLSIKLHLDIDDPVIPENSGRFTLDIDDGQAAVRRGGKGELRMDINTPAALYSGYLAPSQLAQVGRIEGTSGAIAAAGGVFAPTTGTPSMPDMY